MRTYTNLGIAEGFHPLSLIWNNLRSRTTGADPDGSTTARFSQVSSSARRSQRADGTVTDSLDDSVRQHLSDIDRHNTTRWPRGFSASRTAASKGCQHLKYPQTVVLRRPSRHAVPTGTDIPVEISRQAPPPPGGPPPPIFSRALSAECHTSC